LLARRSSHSENPTSVEISFQGHPFGSLEGKEPVAFEECERGSPASRGASFLSKTAGAREEEFFFNGLINRPA
jgi:hypothetical protein